jgi:hypothetical protein
VMRLKKAGWFSNPDVTKIRRHYALAAAADLQRLERDDHFDPEFTGREAEDLKRAIRWFLNEGREASVKIGWLFKQKR